MWAHFHIVWQSERLYVDQMIDKCSCMSQLKMWLLSSLTLKQLIQVGPCHIKTWTGYANVHLLLFFVTLRSRGGAAFRIYDIEQLYYLENRMLTIWCLRVINQFDWVILWIMLIKSLVIFSPIYVRYKNCRKINTGDFQLSPECPPGIILWFLSY